MYNIVGAMFAKESEAREAMAALRETPSFNGTTVYQVSLVKCKDNELKLCDNFTSEYLTSSDLTGGLLGVLIGLLAGPLGAMLGGATGALLGDAMNADKKDIGQILIEEVAQKMEEGDLAMIMIVDEENEGILDHALVNYNVVITRFDAKKIAKDAGIE